MEILKAIFYFIDTFFYFMIHLEKIIQLAFGCSKSENTAGCF